MKTYTRAYQKSMAKIFRNRSYVKISFSNIDTSASSEGEWDGSGMPWSEVETLDYDYNYGASNIATLELNRWVAGSNQVIYDGSARNDGFISSAISGASGECPNNTIIIREFTDVHTFIGMTFKFDTRENDYPYAMRIDYYGENALLDSKIVNPKNSKCEVIFQATDIDEIRITFLTMLPYHRPRLERAMYGIEMVYTNDDIISATQMHDVDPLSRRLPDEQLQFVIKDFDHVYDPDNPNGVYDYLDIHSPIIVQYGYDVDGAGSIEWLHPDTYALSDVPEWADNKVTFSGTGLIGAMTGTYYKSKLGTKNLYDMAIDVLTDANLPLTPLGTNPWDVDNTLKTMYTDAVLPIDSYANCLQLIAHVARCRLYTDDDNIIHIKPYGVTIDGWYKGKFSDTGHEEWSSWEKVNNGTFNDDTYATLELNRWLGGTKQIILPTYDRHNEGFVSLISGVNGVSNTWQRTFEVKHDLPVVSLIFDQVLESYPLKVKIDYYSDSTLVTSHTYEPDDYVYSCVCNDALDVNKIIVTSYDRPYSRSRINKVYYRETNFDLDFTSISHLSQTVEKLPRVRNILVTKHDLTKADNVSDLFECTTTATNLHAEFALADDITITVTGGTIVSQTIYGQAVDLVLSAGTKTVLITGKTMTDNSTVITYPVNSKGEDDEEDNLLVTSHTLADALYNQVNTYLSLRNTYTQSYRGNPEVEVGDIIGLETEFSELINGLVLVDEIDYSGALSGKVVVKGLL